eukprot:NODE_25900_length_571_cov_7.317568.p3 GENE.NODE_25900_length_571_cov_7.317568~~NODE_25900_length_571_cov_7.317568.p3  ORF type:complete len:90 (-),score=33.92 NODE_25900_length_571_cov_7.317568:194-463(-)
MAQHVKTEVIEAPAAAEEATMTLKEHGAVGGLRGGTNHLHNSHPRRYGPGSRSCRVCASQHAIIRKYSIMMCRQCFRERALAIGFKKTR